MSKTEKKDFIVLEKQYKNIIKQEYYELIIEEIINDSTLLFPNRYEHIKKQDHSEPDYIDLITGQKYDAKVLFYQEMCSYIGKGKIQDFVDQLEIMVDEFYDCAAGDQNFSKIRLFEDMRKRINNIKMDEGCIFFFPFSITGEIEKNSLAFHMSNIFQVTYNYLIMSDISMRRDLAFAIYPNKENDVIICDLNNYEKEILHKKYFQKYYHHEKNLEI